VLVQVEDLGRRVPGDVSNVFVRTKDGQMVQLSNLVNVRETVAAKELNHFNKLRAATISAGLAPGYSMDEALTWMDNALHEVAPEAQYDLSGQSREYRESSSDFAMIFLLAIAFIYLVLAAQFESFVDPLVILLAVPLAAFGAFLFLNLANWGTGFHLWSRVGSWNIYSQIGIVTLVGLIAKHGILIVEFSNQLQEQGRHKIEAVVESRSAAPAPDPDDDRCDGVRCAAADDRHRRGRRGANQIGLVIVGGMAIGTFFTLFVVPVIYLLIGRDHYAIAPEPGAHRRNACDGALIGRRQIAGKKKPGIAAGFFVSALGAGCCLLRLRGLGDLFRHHGGLGFELRLGDLADRFLRLQRAAEDILAGGNAALDVFLGDLEALRPHGLELFRAADFGHFAEEGEGGGGAGFEGSQLQAEDLGGVLDGEAVDLGRGVRELTRGGGELLIELLVHAGLHGLTGGIAGMVRCSIDPSHVAVQQPPVGPFGPR
jgi:hypothetical protein